MHECTRRLFTIPKKRQTLHILNFRHHYEKSSNNAYNLLEICIQSRPFSEGEKNRTQIVIRKVPDIKSNPKKLEKNLKSIIE